jgi:hypothetical protein
MSKKEWIFRKIFDEWRVSAVGQSDFRAQNQGFFTGVLAYILLFTNFIFQQKKGGIHEIYSQFMETSR